MVVLEKSGKGKEGYRLLSGYKKVNGLLGKVERRESATKVGSKQVLLTSVLRP